MESAGKLVASRMLVVGEKREKLVAVESAENFNQIRVVKKAGKLATDGKGGKTCDRWKGRQDLQQVERAAKVKESRKRGETFSGLKPREKQ